MRVRREDSLAWSATLSVVRLLGFFWATAFVVVAAASLVLPAAATAILQRRLMHSPLAFMLTGHRAADLGLLLAGLVRGVQLFHPSSAWDALGLRDGLRWGAQSLVRGLAPLLLGALLAEVGLLVRLLPLGDSSCPGPGELATSVLSTTFAWRSLSAQCAPWLAPLAWHLWAELALLGTLGLLILLGRLIRRTQGVFAAQLRLLLHACPRLRPALDPEATRDGRFERRLLRLLLVVAVVVEVSQAWERLPLPEPGFVRFDLKDLRRPLFLVSFWHPSLHLFSFPCGVLAGAAIVGRPRRLIPSLRHVAALTFAGAIVALGVLSNPNDFAVEVTDTPIVHNAVLLAVHVGWVLATCAGLYLLFRFQVERAALRLWRRNARFLPHTLLPERVARLLVRLTGSSADEADLQASSSHTLVLHRLASASGAGTIGLVGPPLAAACVWIIHLLHLSHRVVVLFVLTFLVSGGTLAAGAVLDTRVWAPLRRWLDRLGLHPNDTIVRLGRDAPWRPRDDPFGSPTEDADSPARSTPLDAAAPTPQSPPTAALGSVTAGQVEQDRALDRDFFLARGLLPSLPEVTSRRSGARSEADTGLPSASARQRRTSHPDEDTGETQDAAGASGLENGSEGRSEDGGEGEGEGGSESESGSESSSGAEDGAGETRHLLRGDDGDDGDVAEDVTGDAEAGPLLPTTAVHLSATDQVRALRVSAWIVRSVDNLPEGGLAAVAAERVEAWSEDVGASSELTSLVLRLVVDRIAALAPALRRRPRPTEGADSGGDA